MGDNFTLSRQPTARLICYSHLKIGKQGVTSSQNISKLGEVVVPACQQLLLLLG